jgi:muramoyltetrapeptide carboxypeptidase
MELLRPHPLRPGDTIGVFTPSSPSYRDNEGLFVNGIKNLERLGFKVKLGRLTEARSAQGYRSGTPVARAEELMDLVRDPAVHGLIATIGGYNSSSLIPYLDFAEIRRQQKALCGYSDVTSLHAAILRFSGLSTYYGPAVMTWFGEWPDGIPESSKWFMDSVTQYPENSRRQISPPPRWSIHRRRWDNGDWMSIPRLWLHNDGWRVLQKGSVEAPILALNLNTILSAAGTKYWPDFRGKILMIEDMDAPHGRNERSFRQLSLCGVFDEIAGLIISKPESYDQATEPFTYDELLMEVLGPRSYPVISNFDCGHHVPMITIPQLALVSLCATEDFLDGISFL